ncbi:FMN-binding [uncultured Caudovirales phage]|uniref:FMN-binding n=1 Tax=uncultured Caudovirales phage TaxID=2100421 RepID=A0A6J5KPU6_9CAUD|nr:FMN-binding [uncultured Caudovirales phage]
MAEEQKPKVHLHISQFVWMLLAGLGWTVAALEWMPPADTSSPLGGGLSSSGSKPSPKVSVPTPASTPTATTTAPPTTSTSITGTFVGSAVKNQFGSVQVQITIADNKITDVTALKYPTGGRSSQISQQTIPVLIEQVLAAQSSNINGVTGASYTSQSFYDSLQSALTKAGL